MPFGGPKGNQAFPSSAALRESLITRGTSREQICQTIPKAFPLLVRLQASVTKDNVSRRGGLNIFRAPAGESDSFKSSVPVFAVGNLVSSPKDCHPPKQGLRLDFEWHIHTFGPTFLPVFRD